jgi:prepilin-type N-terminal cleavage/methylation domain-containing protein
MNHTKSAGLMKTKGFTLIELVMVIVIVGILAAVAVPRFDSFYAVKLAGAVRKTASDIRYVQQIAISRHTNTRVVFDTSSETYSAQQESSPGSGTWNNMTDPFTRGNLQTNFTTDAQYKDINIDSVDFGGAGQGTLRFNLEGVPENASGTDLVNDGTVVFTYKGNSNSITVTPNTGRVTVQ